MDKQHIRYYIITHTLLGLNATRIHQELITAYGQECISYPTVAHWRRAFSNGQESVEDDPLSGRPMTAVTQDNINAVKDLVDDDPYISIDYVADVLGISHDSVHTILREHLGLRKLSSKCVPQVPRGQSVRGIYYRDECLKSLVKNLLIKRPTLGTKGIKLHHDNSTPHMRDLVINYLRSEKIEVMAHPPFSPDHSPAEFWLFDYLKDKLHSYPDETSLSEAVTKELYSIPITEYRKTFHKGIERMKLCIEHHGDYFEHLQ